MYHSLYMQQKARWCTQLAACQAAVPPLPRGTLVPHLGKSAEAPVLPPADSGLQAGGPTSPFEMHGSGHEAGSAVPGFPASEGAVADRHFLTAVVTPALRPHPFWHLTAPPGPGDSLPPDSIGLSFDSHPQSPELLLTVKVQKVESPVGPSMDGTSRRQQVVGTLPRSPIAAWPPTMSAGLAYPKDAMGFLPCLRGS